jgi:hypothetical protein
MPTSLRRHLTRALTLLALLLCAPTALAATQQFNVRDFGAKADGITDDQAAIARAIAAAGAFTAAAPGNTATVFFPAGSYALTRYMGPYPITVQGMSRVTLAGETCAGSPTPCAKLIGMALAINHGPRKSPYASGFFYVKDAQDITVENFTLSRIMPLYIQGHILSVDTLAQTLIARLDPGFEPMQSPATQGLNLLLIYPNPAKAQWDRSAAACAPPPGVPNRPGACFNTHITARVQRPDGTWQLTFDKPLPPAYTGKSFILWHDFGIPAAFTAETSRNVTLANIFYSGGGGSAVHLYALSGTNTVRDVTVDVPPGSGQLFAALSGLNGGNLRGTLLIDHVSLTRTNDDGFHFSANGYFPVLDEDETGTHLRLALCYANSIQPGDTLAAWNWPTKQEVGRATVLSLHISIDQDKALYPRTCDITLSAPFPRLHNLRTYSPKNLGLQADPNDRVIDLSSNMQLTVQNSYLSSMGAHCGIVQVSARILNNVCADTTATGLFIGPGYNWGEGYAVNGVTISGNVFRNINGTAIQIVDALAAQAPPTKADILSPLVPAAAPRQDNVNITIANNKFEQIGTADASYAGVRGAAITVQNAQHVRITGNQTNGAPILVSPATTSDVTITP